MAEKKHVDQQKVAEMRRVMAEKGDKAVDERYGSQARATEEYREAQRQAEVQERRDQERRRREIENAHDVADQERRQFQQEQADREAEQDHQRDDQAREQVEQQRQADQDRVPYQRETAVTDRTYDLTPDAAPAAAPAADRGAEQSTAEPDTPAGKTPDRSDQLLAEVAAKREAREREGVSR